VSTLADCYADSRTAVSLTLYELPVVTDETLTFCEGEDIILNANITGVTYYWNTGETTSDITVNTAGNYTLTVTDPNGCQSTKTITLNQIDRPIIASVSSEEYTISILTKNLGEFEYSLDGFNFRDQNNFENREGGQYTIYVREKNGCGLATLEYLHLVIPNFFTPNGANHYDLFIINGTGKFENSER